MKSKKNINIVLIALLCCIWGAIGYKYFFKRTPVQETVTSTENLDSVAYTIEKDTFQLQRIQDPFSGRKVRTVATKLSTTTSKSGNRKNTAKKVVKPIAWPKIIYRGYMFADGNKTKKIAALNVNGKFMKQRVGDIILEQIKIVQIYEDSIKLGMNKEYKIIKKNR